MTTIGAGDPLPSLINPKNNTHMETKNEYWHGLRGVRFLWHGDMEEAELRYRGHVIDECEVTNHFWAAYQLGNPEPDTVNGTTWKEYAEDGYHDYIVSHGKDVRDFIIAHGCPTTTLARTWRRVRLVRKALR